MVSARRPRFEIVRGDHGWHARFRAANGRIVWVTETYRRRAAAERAVCLLGTPDRRRGLLCWLLVAGDWVEVRDIDARTGATP